MLLIDEQLLTVVRTGHVRWVGQFSSVKVPFGKVFIIFKSFYRCQSYINFRQYVSSSVDLKAFLFFIVSHRSRCYLCFVFNQVICGLIVVLEHYFYRFLLIIQVFMDLELLTINVGFFLKKVDLVISTSYYILKLNFYKNIFY